jgi:hypothetical protein
MARFASYVEVLVAHLRSSPYDILSIKERERERADVDVTGVSYGVNISSSSWSMSAYTLKWASPELETPTTILNGVDSRPPPIYLLKRKLALGSHMGG